MRALLFGAGILAIAGAMSTHAHAQNYPWCAYYGSIIGGGGTNCGFTSFEQCMATVSGIGGYCARNNLYRPPVRYHRPIRRRRHRWHHY